MLCLGAVGMTSMKKNHRKVLRAHSPPSSKQHWGPVSWRFWHLCTPMGHPMVLVHHFWVKVGVWSIVALIAGKISRNFSFFFIIFCPFLPIFPIFAIFAHFAHFAHPYGPPHGLGSSLVAWTRLYKSLCRSVGRSVCRSPFTFFCIFELFEGWIVDF